MATDETAGPPWRLDENKGNECVKEREESPLQKMQFMIVKAVLMLREWTCVRLCNTS